MAKRKRNKKSKLYFTKETEDAIIRYNETPDQEEREYLFNTYIYKPLDKIAENIINRFKFMYTHLAYEDLKAQVVSFLVINLHKFEKSKGNAFSYFSIIAKNYLIFQNNNGWKDEKNKIYLSDVDEETTEENDWLLVGEEHVEHNKEMKDFIKLFVAYWEKNIDNVFKKKKEKDIVSAIIQLLKNSDGIDSLNKKSCYLYIRQMVDYKTSTITKVISQVKDKVYKQLEEYHKTGTISS